MLSVPHAPRLEDQNILRKKSTFRSRRVTPSRSFSRTRGACSQTLGPPTPPRPFAFFLYFASCFFGRWDPERAKKGGAFLTQISPGKGWKKFKKVKKGKKRRHRRPIARQHNQIIVNPVRDFSNFGRRRFGIEGVEQIADRRSARVQALTKKLSE